MTLVTNGVDAGYHLISTVCEPVYRSDTGLSEFLAISAAWLTAGCDCLDSNPFPDRARLSSDTNLGTGEAPTGTAPSSVVLVACQADRPARCVVVSTSRTNARSCLRDTDGTLDHVDDRGLAIDGDVAVSVRSPFHGVCLVTMMVRLNPSASSCSIESQFGLGGVDDWHG